MNIDEKHFPVQILFVIADPKPAQKALNLFQSGSVPIQYQWNAEGTASREIIDTLGLGNPKKTILLSVLPKYFSDTMLDKLKDELKLGMSNSGIAFTLPLSGVNNLLLQILNQMSGDKGYISDKRKEDIIMPATKYSLVVAVVNQGYSETVMRAARKEGASGGTVVHSRRMGNNEIMNFWGMSIQEEKDMVFIVVSSENKLKIMQTIGENCGIRSEAQGIILSLPIETVIGMNKD